MINISYMIKQRKYDLVIIGYGAAGFAAAIKASEITEGNAKIALIGKGNIGGTCVNVGCIPSKYLLEISHKYFYSNKLPGMYIVSKRLNFEEIMKGVKELVEDLRKEKYEKVIESYNNVDLIKGEATFTYPNIIEVKTEEGKIEIEGDKFIIATGSRATIPNIEGINNVEVLTSDNVWEIRKLPYSLGVIGGGAIGLELGQAFLHFGTKVSLIEILPRIAYTAEPEISELLEKILKEEGMEIYTRVKSIKIKEKKIEVSLHDKKKEIEVEQILVATGRRPNTDSLNLEKAMVKTDERGFIITDSNLRTSNPNIFAAGDVIKKKLMLETLAAREGVIAAINAFGGKETIDYTYVPWAIFTYPQIASVGYLEEEYVKKTGACSCRIISLEDIPKGKMLKEEGLIKIIIDPNTDKIVGVHALSPFATEFIIEGVLAIKYGLTIWDIIDTIHVFPTLSEGLKLASQSFIRDISKMSCCVE
jgi:mercuric reductase